MTAAGAPSASGWTDVTGAPLQAVGGRSTRPIGRAVRRFRSDRAAMGALAFVVALVVLGVAAPWIATHDPVAQSATPFEAPSLEHLLGTDDLGRDTFSRLLDGTQVSMRAAFQTVVTALLVAVPLGLAAGYIGGRSDQVLLRVMDAVASFPALILALAIVAVLGPGLGNAMIAITIVLVPGFVRLVRAQTMAAMEETFVEASRSIGTRPLAILRRRVLPNVTAPLVVAGSMALGIALLAEAGLSFLGLGVQPPEASWGQMLRRANDYIHSEPFQMIPPGGAIALAVLAFNVLGDGLCDSLSTRGPHRTDKAERGPLGVTLVRRVQSTAGEELSPGVEGLLEPDLLRVRNLSVCFDAPSGPRTVVRDVSLDVAEGEVLGIVGESGSGKTVTALAIMRLLPTQTARVTAAKISFDGRDLLSTSARQLRALRGSAISMVFQDPMSSLNPALTVGDQLTETVRWHGGDRKARATSRALELLGTVGVAAPRSRLGDYPHQLSGGTLQRVLIAMALANEPKLLIADEPTTALDVTVQAQILGLLRVLQESLAMAMIFVSHDMAVVADLCDDVTVLHDGEVIESSPARTFFNGPDHAYSRALLEAATRSGEPGFGAERCDRTERSALETIDGSRLAAERDEQSSSCVAPPTHVRSAFGHRPAQRSYASGAVNASIERVGTARIEDGRPPLLEGRALRKSFPLRRAGVGPRSQRVHALDGVDLTIRRGESVGLVGESGSGKTTLARIATRLLEPSGGTVHFEGHDISHVAERRLRPLRQHMQFVFQDPFAALAPFATVADSVSEPLKAHRRLRGRDLSRSVDELLEAVKIDRAHGSRYPHELSGGQLQRIALARALATRPRLVVLDEPMSALDGRTRAAIIDLLSELRGDYGLAYLLIAHDLTVVRQLSDRIMVAYCGRIVEHGVARTVYSDPKHPYTRALVSAIPKLPPERPGGRDRIVLGGEPPSPIEPPRACRFHPRCPDAMDVCRHVDPPLVVTHDGTSVACHLHSGYPRPTKPSAGGCDVRAT